MLHNQAVYKSETVQEIYMATQPPPIPQVLVPDPMGDSNADVPPPCIAGYLADTSRLPPTVARQMLSDYIHERKMELVLVKRTLNSFAAVKRLPNKCLAGIW